MINVFRMYILCMDLNIAKMLKYIMIFDEKEIIYIFDSDLVLRIKG